VCTGRMMPRKAIAGHNAAEPGFKREEANSSDDRKLLRTLNVISFHFASGIQMQATKMPVISRRVVSETDLPGVGGTASPFGLCLRQS